MKIGVPIYTIGHSNRSIEDFVELLRIGSVERVVDVRTVPRSRANPQFNEDILPATLAGRQIAYERIAELGGLRGRSQTVPPEVNAFWQNGSFHNYADYALSAGFDNGLDRLMKLADERKTAIMCAEAVWWRCHRRIIADYLLFRGREVFHLMDKLQVEPARMTAAAKPHGDRLIYPS